MISGIHISSSQMLIKDEGSNKQNLPGFKNNQIVKAKILQRMPNGKALILVGNQKIMAKTAMLLKPGEDVQLQVISQSSDIVLKLIHPVQKLTTKQISSLVTLFSKNSSIIDITDSRMEKIKDIFYEISLKSGKTDKNFLPRLIDKSGITFENKIVNILSGSKSDEDIKIIMNNLLKQDIKGSILQELLAGAQNPLKTGSAKMASLFLETMENFQLLNHQSSDSGRFLLPFPIFSESTFSFGQLLIETGDKNKNRQKDSDKIVNISFLLDMSELGPVRADFSILKKDISGEFLLQNSDTCEFVKSMIPELKTRLAKIEYRAVQIECKTVSKVELDPGSLIEALIKTGDDRIVNLVI